MRMSIGTAAVLGVAGLAMGQSCEPGDIFGPFDSYQVGRDSNAVLTADLDGDGDEDVVVANAAGFISVLLNQGDGTLGTEQRFAVGDFPQDLATGDFNGDGILDLVSANRFDDNVSILLGLGDGTFGSQATFSGGFGPFGVAATDLNGDGRDDILVTRSVGGGNSIDILINRGDATFEAPQQVTVGVGPRKIATADVNADGATDVLTANRDSNDISVALGRGDGTFEMAVQYLVGNLPDSLDVADLNGDGTLDVVVLNGSREGVSVLLGNGDGTFDAETRLSASDPTGPGLADFNGDGIVDLLVGSRSVQILRVHVGRGDGTFELPQEFPTSGQVRAVTVADMNGDGAADAIPTRAPNLVSVFLNQCGPFTDPCRADLDGDGELTIFDFLAFQNLFDMGDPIADFDGDGSLTLFDFLEFQNQFAAGCP